MRANDDSSRCGSEDASSLDAAMALAARGDVAAFERVFASTRASLLRAMHRATGDAILAEDVVQETYVKLWHARSSYQPDMPVLPWLRTIARRVLIDALRRARVERDALRSLRATVHWVEPRGEAQIDARRASDRALEALLQLPPKQAQALFAAATEGPSISDLARRAGDTPLAMRLRVHRARAALRNSIGDYAIAAE